MFFLPYLVNLNHNYSHHTCVGEYSSQIGCVFDRLLATKFFVFERFRDAEVKSFDSEKQGSNGYFQIVLVRL